MATDVGLAQVAQVEQVEQVVLVDDEGRPVGRRDKAGVHGPDTPRHLAFSCWVVDGAGLVLLTRRALTKATWPGVWTNACCGHPAPDEPMTDAVRRRLDHELGLRLGPDADAVRCVLPDFSYRAVDAGGTVENELCPVHVARVAGSGPDTVTIVPDPSEVAEYAWAPWPRVRQAMAALPFAFSPWSVEQSARLGDDG